MCPSVRHEQYRRVISVDEVILKKDTEFFQIHKIQKKSVQRVICFTFMAVGLVYGAPRSYFFFFLLGSKRDECPSGYESFPLSKTKLHAP